MTKKMLRQKPYLFALLVLAAIMALSSPATAQKAAGEIGTFDGYYHAYDIPRTFPDISFKNALGKDMAISDLKGSWVIVNFWASWCPPCIQEMPTLQALQDKYSGKAANPVRVVAIALDRQMTADILRQVMMKYHFGPVAAYYGDWLAIRDQVDIPGLPTTYILNPQGQAVGTITAPINWTSDQVLTYMDRLSGR